MITCFNMVCKEKERGKWKEKAINITLIAYSKGEMSRMKDSNTRF